MWTQYKEKFKKINNRKYEGESVILDLYNLIYISFAGVKVIQGKKQDNDNTYIRNQT